MHETRAGKGRRRARHYFSLVLIGDGRLEGNLIRGVLLHIFSQLFSYALDVVYLRAFFFIFFFKTIFSNAKTQ